MDVFLARSFGFRDLTESMVVLAPGLALLLQHASSLWFRVLNGFLLILAIWNLLLVGAYANAMLPQISGASPQRMCVGVQKLFDREPDWAMAAILGSILIAFSVSSEVRQNNRLKRRHRS